jgi:protocatechuate 3,4-dioxygenase, alpha subunit
MMRLVPTPSQTVGPFFSIGLERLSVSEIAGPDARGEHVTIAGGVLDGDGQPVPDAVLEIWQPDANGKYPDPEDTRHTQAQRGFTGFGRIPTNDRGEFRFTTIKPGCVPGPNRTMQAPHLVVSVFMRGLLKRLVTRIYFPDDPRNTRDFVLNLLPPERRETLIARKSGTANELEWNVILQGPRETVFFDC